MRRMIVAACAVLLVVGASAAAAGDARPQIAAGDSQLVAHDVFGLQTLELQHFAFAAKTNADGTASGAFSYKDIEDGAPFTAGGHVTCLTVIGDDAWVGAAIDQSNDPTVVGLGGWWHVTDVRGGPDVTTFLGIGSPAATQAFCDTWPPYRHPFDVERGGVIVGG
jgi:hypothetical protein